MQQIYPFKDCYDFFICYPKKLIDLVCNKFTLESVTYYSSNLLDQSMWKRGIELRFSIIICGLGFSYRKNIEAGTELDEEDDEVVYINEKKAWQALSAIATRNWKNGRITELAQATLDNEDIEPLIEQKYWKNINE